MKRNTTVLVLCGLFLLADLLWLRETIGERNGMALAATLGEQAMSAAFLFCVGFLVMRKKYARQKKPVRGQAVFAILQPLRRLFAAVLS